MLASFTVALAHARGCIDSGRERELAKLLAHVPELVTQVLKLEDRIADLARNIFEARDVLYLGRGNMYPLALEGALKLKEITYIHAEGYAAGELKHGPIALIDDAVPVIVLARTMRCSKKPPLTCRRFRRAAARCC